jgi:hypothetical protein
MIMKTFLVLLLLSASAAYAAAQEVTVEDDAAYVDAPYDIDDDADTADLPVGPRVYGWSSAPANCGTFKYWNGEYCADARFEPPTTQD